MNTVTVKAIARNMGALAAIALPVALLVGAIQQLVAPVEWSRGTEADASGADGLLTFLYWYVVLVWPLLVGGGLHQTVILILRRFFAYPVLRVGAVLSSPTVLGGFALVGGSGSALFLPRTTIPLLALLVTYCAIIWRSPAGDVGAPVGKRRSTA